MKNIGKIELLQKLNSRVKDLRGNENERLVAEKQLDILMKKYGITEEDLGTLDKKRRNIYFKSEWELKLIHQTLYMLFGDISIYKNSKKRNWLWVELTDAEYIEWDMTYSAYKGSFQKELDIFYLAFINKNRIFPPDDKAIEPSGPDKYSRGDRMRAAMMAEGIEFTRVRRQIGDGKN